MVFGAVERDSRRLWRRDVLRRFLLPVTEDVDVEPVLGDVVSESVLAGSIVVVTDDFASVTVVRVFELDDEPDDVSVFWVEPKAATSVVVDRNGEFAVVLFWCFTHSFSHTVSWPA